MIEELIRIKGFKKIKLVAPERIRENETLNFKQKLFHLSQRSLASKDISETVTWSFTDSKIDGQFSKNEKEISILNPISSDLDVLRRVNLFKSFDLFKKEIRIEVMRMYLYLKLGQYFLEKILVSNKL